MEFSRQGERNLGVSTRVSHLPRYAYEIVTHRLSLPAALEPHSPVPHLMRPDDRTWLELGEQQRKGRPEGGESGEEEGEDMARE